MLKRKLRTAFIAGVIITSMGLIGAQLGSSRLAILDPVEVNWPIRVEYNLTYNNGNETAHKTTFVWQAESLLEWTTVQICCDEHEVGTTMRVQNDGRVFFGGNDGSPIAYQSTHEPHDGLVPIPEFGPKYPTDLAALQELDYITILAGEGFESAVTNAEKLVAIANSLNLEPSEVIGYRVTTPSGDYTDRWVYKPLNLALLSEEVVAGRVIRRLSVLRLIELTMDVAGRQ